MKPRTFQKAVLFRKCVSIGQSSAFTLVVKGLERIVDKRLLVRTVFIYFYYSQNNADPSGRAV